MVVPNKNLKKRITFINEQIRAYRILLIDEEGNKLGLFPRNEALQKAQEEEKDLVQMGYNSEEKIATAKLIEYGKFLYQQKKVLNEKKKTQKIKGIKEVKIGYNIGDNDLDMKIKKTREFLEEGFSVKIIGVLKGREKVYKKNLYLKIEKAIEILEDISKNIGDQDEKNGFIINLIPKSK